MTTITPRQLQVLLACRRYHERHGYMPTMRELAREIGCRHVSAYDHLEALERRGLMKRGEGRRYRDWSFTPEGLAVPDPQGTACRWKVIGTLSAAGMKLTGEAN